MKVIILGAGVIGVTTAWYLQKSGHDVTVVDRLAAPAEFASARNGGQISICHSIPWASPTAPLKILKWLGREDAPLLFRFGLDKRWFWGARFLRECTPFRTRENTRQIVSLASYSHLKLRELRAETGIDADFLDKGILHFYTNETAFKAGKQDAKMLQELGVNRVIKNSTECFEIEPALKQSRSKIVGGTYTEIDFSGDASKFTKRLAALCKEDGVRFMFNTRVQCLMHKGDMVTGVLAANEQGEALKLVADLYVVAMGSYSPLLLNPLGIYLPIIPIAGYSATIPVSNQHTAPFVSLIDDEAKIVISRYPDRLRIAGTAEVNGFNLDLNLVRCEALIKRAQQIFPNAGDFQQAKFWKGLRPCEPGGYPSQIGRTKFLNLFNNSGHSTLGFTLACGSAAAITDIINNKQPEPDFCFAKSGAMKPEINEMRN